MSRERSVWVAGGRAAVLGWVLAACSLLVGASGCRCSPRRPRPVSTQNDALILVTLRPPGAPPVRVRAELAVTPRTREIGLMYRGELPQGRGMLFAFPREEVQVFWMKNTLVPLDMIFISRGKSVVGVVANAKPLTTTPRSVSRPSMYVLEVNAGFASRHGIVPGTKVEFELPDWAKEDLEAQRARGR